jgi:hypothetical protein
MKNLWAGELYRSSRRPEFQAIGDANAAEETEAAAGGKDSLLIYWPIVLMIAFSVSRSAARRD